MEVPSASSSVLFSGWSFVAATGLKAMPFLANTGARSTSMSSGVLQPTATQGLDGTKWYFGSLVTTVSVSPGRSWSFIS